MTNKDILEVQKRVRKWAAAREKARNDLRDAEAALAAAMREQAELLGGPVAVAP